MRLSELAAYAAEKYQIAEERKWSDFPGFSVLCHPSSGKWAALLMRQWDFDLGLEVERCDIRCPRELLSAKEAAADFLTPAFRMKGRHWTGVIFDDTTDPETVFRLFDLAVSRMEGTFVLSVGAAGEDGNVYHDTYLPIRRGFPKAEGTDAPAASEKGSRPGAGEEAGQLSFSWDYIAADSSRAGASSAGRAASGSLRTGRERSFYDRSVPEKIAGMLRLYTFGRGSFAEKCRNFVRQAAFMADYEDDTPWEGEFTRYFPTYHDLNLRQLRGYFTWRTALRHGDVRKTALSFAYIYLYELLNCIGVSSPEEALRKMREFEASYLDVGYGDAAMRKNLHRWMLEFAVLHRLPREEALLLQDAEILGTDRALLALHSPEKEDDEALLPAILFFLKPKAGDTPVLTKSAEGPHLFTEVWRYASTLPFEDGKDLFAACFGKRGVYVWHPLANAVWTADEKPADTEYVLNECRRFFCKGGVWREERYESLYFDRDRFRTLFRAADRLLRRYLKTGSYLKERPDEAWADPIVEAVISSDRAEKDRAAHPEITIDFSGLADIRRDAAVTRESLLTDEEKGYEAPGTAAPEPKAIVPRQEAEAPEYEQGFPAAGVLPVPPEEYEEIKSPAVPEGDEGTDCPAAEYISAEDIILVRMLLQGEDPSAYLSSIRRMPSLAADFINEALYDEIGDTVLECSDGRLTVIEDYREDLERLLNGG